MYGAFPNTIDFLAPRKNDSVELVVCDPGGDTGGKVVSMYGALPNTDDFLATRDGIEAIVNDAGHETLATWTVFDDAHSVLPHGNRLIGRKFMDVSELDSRRLIGSKFAANDLYGSDDETEAIGMDWGDEFSDADDGFSNIVKCLRHMPGAIGNCEDLKLTEEELIENWVVEDSCGEASIGSVTNHTSVAGGGGGCGSVSSVNSEDWDDGGCNTHAGHAKSRESLMLSLSGCHHQSGMMDGQMQHSIPLVACT